MKKLIAGIVFFVTGVVILLFIHQNTVINIAKLERVTIALGEYGTSLRDTYGIIPMIISIIFVLFGFIMIITSCYEKDKKTS